MLPKRIVAIGASTIYGRVDPEQGGFVTQLRRVHEERSREHAVFNLGLSGDTSTELLRRMIPECSVRRPDLIILSIGTNDTRREGSTRAATKTEPKKFEDNISRLIVSGRNLCSVMVVGMHPIDERKTTPLGGRDWYFFEKDVLEFASLQRQVCEKLSTPYVDLFSKWSATPKERYLHSDGLHLSTSGHQLLFEAVDKTITTIYDSRR